MESTKSKTANELKPPYGNVAWYEKFFGLIRGRSFEKFDTEIIELNVIGGSNTRKFFRGLRFLGLIEENGKTTEKFESLRRRGEEFKQNLKKVVEEAYSHLFSIVVVEKATSDNMLNYLAEYCGYGEYTAVKATKIFAYLCEKSGIALSPELTTIEFKSKGKVEKRKRKQERRIAGRKTKGDMPMVLEGMQKIEYGDNILMFLRKGDKSTRERIANTAKKFIDIYVEEEESRTENS